MRECAQSPLQLTPHLHAAEGPSPSPSAAQNVPPWISAASGHQAVAVLQQQNQGRREWREQLIGRGDAHSRGACCLFASQSKHLPAWGAEQLVLELKLQDEKGPGWQEGWKELAGHLPPNWPGVQGPCFVPTACGNSCALRQGGSIFFQGSISRTRRRCRIRGLNAWNFHAAVPALSCSRAPAALPPLPTVWTPHIGRCGQEVPFQGHDSTLLFSSG